MKVLSMGPRKTSGAKLQEVSGRPDDFLACTRSRGEILCNKKKSISNLCMGGAGTREEKQRSSYSETGYYLNNKTKEAISVHPGE